jgi:hypothetical protein
MPGMPDLSARDELRICALNAALGLSPLSLGELFQSADACFAWLARHKTAQLSISTMVIHGEAVVFAGQFTQGRERKPPVMTAMQDVDTATISVEPEDSMGQETGDSLAITQDDGGTPTTGGAAATPGSVANVTYEVASGITTVTLAPVAEGTVTLSIADPSAPDLAPWTNTFTVSASATSQLVANVTVNAGANTPPAPSA